MNYHLLPRRVGNPNQTVASTEEELLNFLNENNGKNPCFVALYRERPTVTGEREVEVDKVAHDLEGKTEDVKRDVRSLVTESRSLGIPFKLVYTGGKGFHFYNTFEPEWMKESEAKTMINAVQNTFIDRLSLSTSDPHVIGDSRRLLRFPGCLYVGKASNWTQTRTVKESPGNRRTTLREFVADESIQMDGTISRLYPLGPVRAHSISNSDYELQRETLRTFIPFPCLSKSVMDVHNPTHFARVFMVTWLREIGWSPSRILSAIGKLSWKDYVRETSAYHVTHVYSNVHNVPSCSKIKERGLCVGSSCPFYKRFFKESVKNDSVH